MKVSVAQVQPLPATSSEAGAPGRPAFPQFGDYELLELLARGGMGVVYKARQISLNRTVALKTIQAGVLATPAEVKRFHAEAEAVARLQHPNIVVVHEIGQHDGQHFFSMDYVAGRTLAEIVRDGPLPATRAAVYVETIAEAVHYAHQQGILHRDLKPANVIIDEHDQPRITDFGLAKKLTDSQLTTLNPQLTLSGQVLGSPNYLPPEQADPKHGTIGPPSDVYALGAILYHLVTGRPPFQAESLTTLLRQVIETEPVAPRRLNLGIPRDLETICLKCLEKEPRRRYATAQALADDLGRFLSREPVMARPVAVPGRTWRWCRRQPVRAGLIAALFAVFVAGTVGVFWQWRQAAAQRRAAVAAGAEAQIGEYSTSIALAQSLIQARQFAQARESLLARTGESYRGWEWGWLMRSCNQDLMTLSDNPSLGGTVVFTPDSKFLVTSFFEGVVPIWELATGKIVGRFGGHKGYAVTTSFSSDGTRLGTVCWAGEDRSARVWDAKSQQMLFAPLKHPDQICSALLSKDGRRLVTGGADGEVRVYDATTGANTGLTNDYGDAVTAMAFSPDDRRIAYGGGSWGWTRGVDSSIRIWSPATGETKRLAGHEQTVYGLAWSPDGTLLVSCGMDGKVKAWDPDSGKELLPFEASPKQQIMCRADFSPDGRWLAVGGGDLPYPTARATLFEVRTRRVVHEFAGHSAAVQGIRFSPDGRYLATASFDGTVKLWRVPPLPEFLSLEGHSQPVWTAVFSPDGSRVATGSLDQTARIWDAETGVLLRTILVRFPVISLGFSPNGRQLVTPGPDNSACIWNVEPPDSASRGRREGALEGEVLSLTPRFSGVETSPRDTGNRFNGLVTGKTVETVASHVRQPVTPLKRGVNETFTTVGQQLLASAATTQEQGQLRGHTRAVMAVAWSPDGRWIATGSKDNTARIWDAATGLERVTLSGHSNLIHTVAFSPDAKVLATGSADGTARFWATSDGQCLQVLSNHKGAVLSLAFSPNGRWLATGSRDGSARLWETGTGRQVHLLPGQVNGVSSVAFSPDSQRLVTATGGVDLYSVTERATKVYFWDVASGRQLLALDAHLNMISAATFDSGGQHLVTASCDNTARIWTAFPWRSDEYPGDTDATLATRVEQLKRRFWKLASTNQNEADASGRPWTNGFYLYHYTYGDMNLPAPGSKTQPLFPIPARPPQAGAKQVDLGGVYNVALNESWQTIGSIVDVDRSLMDLAAGRRDFEGVSFDVRGMIQLRGAAPDSWLHPERVRIPVGQVFRRFHVLHGATWFEPPGRQIGAFVLHYADGKVAEVPILFGEHLRGEDVRVDSWARCSKGRQVWGPEVSGGRGTDQPRVYQAAFANPIPTVRVECIEFTSKLTKCGPFLLALSLE